MAVIYLLRHGQASFGAADYDQLSQTGALQAKRLGEVLRAQLPNADLLRMQRGSLNRHQQSAEHLLQGLGIEAELEIDDGWNEFNHEDVLQVQEQAQGQTLRQLIAQSQQPEQDFQEFFVAAITRWVTSRDTSSYQENWPQFKERVQQAFHQSQQGLDKDSAALVVTSGGPISLVTQLLLGLDDETALRLNWRLVNGGITKVSVGRNGAQLLSLNEHQHFAGEHQHLLSYR